MSNYQPASRDHEATAGNVDRNTTPERTNGNNAANNHFEGLRRYATDGSVMMPLEALEKLYLNPPNKVSGHLRQTFGNPTPM